MQSRIDWRFVVRIGAPLAALGFVVVVSCSGDSSFGPTTRKDKPAPPSPLHALTAEQKQRLDAVKARTRWAGEAHHAAMQVVIASIRQGARGGRSLPKKGSTGYCSLMESAGDVALTILDRHREVNRSKAMRVAAIRRNAVTVGCPSAPSVFGPSFAPPSTHLATSQEIDPEVTGAYEAYLGALHTAVTGSNGTVVAVQSGVEAVLTNAVADGIAEGDLLALASFAGVIVSSAEEWNAFDWSYADGGCGSQGCGEMSVFPIRRVDSRPLKVIGADAGGCLSTVKGWGALKAILVGPPWAELAGECGLRATRASGAAILVLM